MSSKGSSSSAGSSSASGSSSSAGGSSSSGSSSSAGGSKSSASHSGSSAKSSASQTSSSKSSSKDSSKSSLSGSSTSGSKSSSKDSASSSAASISKSSSHGSHASKGSKSNKSSSSGKSASAHGSSSVSSSSAVSSKALLAATASSMRAPSSVADTNSLAKTKGAKKANSMSDIEATGFKIGQLIAEGEQDTFYEATLGGKMILCKKTSLKSCSPRFKDNLLDTSLRVERFMGGNGSGQAQSANFIVLFDIFQLHHDLYTFMEQVPGKSLYLRLADGQDIPANTAREWTVQLLGAIMKMQEVGVAHRYLTVRHVLFDQSDKVKIAGWSKSVIYWDPTDGGSALLQQAERRSRKNSHLPPECFRGPYDPSKVDIWSVGVIMVAMNTGRFPFNVTSGFKFSAQWRQFVTVQKMNRSLRAACNQCYWIDPVRRTTPAELLKHQYFTSSQSVIATKELKTTVDPKHDPTAFEGADPSMGLSGIDACSQNGSSQVGDGSSRNGSSSAVSSTAPSGTSKSKSSVASGLKSKNKSSDHSSSSASNSNSSASASSSSTASSSAADDIDPGSDNASGSEGGSVTDSVPASESAYESQASENSAPEESASSAKPVSVSSKSIHSSSAVSSSKQSSKSKSRSSSSSH